MGLKKLLIILGCFSSLLWYVKVKLTKNLWPAIFLGATRGATRGATSGGDDYDNGRVGYGSVATTSSSVSTMEYVDGPKLVIPFRFKVLKDSEITAIMGSKDLASAMNAEELQKMYQPKVF